MAVHSSNSRRKKAGSDPVKAREEKLVREAEKRIEASLKRAASIYKSEQKQTSAGLCPRRVAELRGRQMTVAPPREPTTDELKIRIASLEGMLDDAIDERDAAKTDAARWEAQAKELAERIGALGL